MNKIVNYTNCNLLIIYRYSQFQKEYTLNEILESPKVFGPLTKLQCCPTSDGSAAAILASEQFVIKNNLQDQAIEIVGMEMATDPPTTFSGQTCVQIVNHKYWMHIIVIVFKVILFMHVIFVGRI